jgi:copper chaperone NosL
MRSSIVLLALLAACAPVPQPMMYGAESCEQCRMTVSEPGFAARALFTTGKAHAFDSVECLAAWLAESGRDADRLHSLWVQEFGGEERWLAAETAGFVQGGEVRSPMGAAITAHPDAAAAREHAARHGGEVLEWEALRARVAASGGHAHAH